MTEARRFVLLEHRWQGVHYDLMLEVDGVLKTWKLFAPLHEGEQPAEASFDHRLIYLDYEGTVSGDRGEVTRVEAGVYRGEVAPARVEVELDGQTLIGRLNLKAEANGQWRLEFQPRLPVAAR